LLGGLRAGDADFLSLISSDIRGHPGDRPAPVAQQLHRHRQRRALEQRASGSELRNLRRLSAADNADQGDFTRRQRIPRILS
jgi:hypothetical protein